MKPIKQRRRALRLQASLQPSQFKNIREARCGTWWRGANETERFRLYYTCLRLHYEMTAREALETARKNWPSFGPQGDLIANVKIAIRG